MRQVSVFEGGYVVVSRKDGWEIDVERGVRPVTAQWLADVLGIGVDYITVDDLPELVERACEARREYASLIPAETLTKARADRNAALAALAGDGWKR
jgi:hypothetical protein